MRSGSSPDYGNLSLSLLKDNKDKTEFFLSYHNKSNLHLVEELRARGCTIDFDNKNGRFIVSNSDTFASLLSLQQIQTKDYSVVMVTILLLGKVGIIALCVSLGVQSEVLIAICVLIWMIVMANVFKIK
jgi:hypothetical protein